jgi:hypothetical protein
MDTPDPNEPELILAPSWLFSLKKIARESPLGGILPRAGEKKWFDLWGS